MQHLRPAAVPLSPGLSTTPAMRSPSVAPAFNAVGKLSVLAECVTDLVTKRFLGA